MGNFVARRLGHQLLDPAGVENGLVTTNAERDSSLSKRCLMRSCDFAIPELFTDFSACVQL